MSSPETAPTQSDINAYDMLLPMLDSAIKEMREFAKKKPDGIVSASKIKLLNRLLTKLKELLKGEPTREYLDVFSEEELPQNSDAVLVLGQYRAALGSFEKTHKRRDGGYDLVWITKEWYAKHRGRQPVGDDEDEGEDE